MAERTLKKKRRDDLPMLLIRPAIIIGSYEEPMQGWVDTLSAAGALSLVGGSGLINYFPGDTDITCDIIPVDYVSNSILVATAFQANKRNLTVINNGTSHQNPTTWGFFIQRGINYINQQPFSV